MFYPVVRHKTSNSDNLLLKKPLMKTILIATDFSSAARNATKYGFESCKDKG